MFGLMLIPPVVMGLSAGGFAAAVLIGYSAGIALGATLYLTLIAYIPTYRQFLQAVAATVLVIGIGLFADLPWDDALEFTLMIAYGLLPFAVAGGAMYGQKVLGRLLWSFFALVPAGLVYLWIGPEALLPGPGTLITSWWPLLLLFDVIVLGWFSLALLFSRRRTVGGGS